MNPALRSSRMPDLPLAHHYIVCWPPCSRSGASGAPNISPFDPNSGVTRPDGKAWGIGTGKDHQGYQPPRSPGVQARAIELLVAPDVSRRVCTWSDRTWRHLRFIKESAIAQRSRLDCWSDGRATARSHAEPAACPFSSTVVTPSQNSAHHRSRPQRRSMSAVALTTWPSSPGWRGVLVSTG
jgi:hypothetical protein